MVTMVWVVSRN